MDDVFKALADPNRRKLLDRLGGTVSVASEVSTAAKRVSTDDEKLSSAVIRLFQSSARISSPALLPPNCSTNVPSGPGTGPCV